MIPHLGELSLAVRELNHPRVAEKQSCRKAKSPKGFWPPLRRVKTPFRGGPLCPRLRPRRANHSPADPRDAGTRHPARLGDRLAGNEIDSGASQRETREKLLEAPAGPDRGRTGVAARPLGPPGHRGAGGPPRAGAAPRSLFFPH